MEKDHLNKIFNYVHRTHFPGRLRKVKAEFYRSRSLRHTVDWNAFRIRARISNIFKNAPVYIIEALALMLLSRVYRLRVDAQAKTIYRSYVNQLNIAGKSYKPSYAPDGTYFNLETLFNQLNQTRFSSTLRVSVIGWSKRKSYTRLGFYDKHRNLIVISKIFDNPQVPLNVLQYLIFHEMLHIQYPEEIRYGRRRIHTAAFRDAEKKFPGYDEIQDWIKKNLRRL